MLASTCYLPHESFLNVNLFRPQSWSTNYLDLKAIRAGTYAYEQRILYYRDLPNSGQANKPPPRSLTSCSVRTGR